MGSLDIFLWILILGSSPSMLTSHPLARRFDSDATHRVILPPIYSSDSGYGVKVPPTQQFPNKESYSSSSYPFDFYHSLHNADFLPADVELVPADVAASSSDNKKPISLTPEDHFELVPDTAEYMMNLPSVISYYHHHLNHPHHHRPIRPIRPLRPMHPLRPIHPMRPIHPTSFYPAPEPPVWTIPPDVEIYPHEKPSDSGPPPSKPAHTPRPFYPPAIPSYGYSRSAGETNQTSQQLILDDKYNNFSRSAFDFDNVTAALQMPTRVPHTTVDDMVIKPENEQIWLPPPFEVLDFPLKPRVEYSKSHMYKMIVILPPKVLKDEELPPAYFGKPTTAEDSSRQIAPESSETGFSLSEHKADTLYDSTLSEEASRLPEDSSSGAEDTGQAVNIDFSLYDLPNMQAVFPEESDQPPVVENPNEELSALTDNGTEIDHREYQTEEWKAEAQLAHLVEEELKKIGLSNGGSVSGEGAVGEETDESNEESNEETELVNWVRRELKRLASTKTGGRVSGQDTVEEETEANVDNQNYRDL